MISKPDLEILNYTNYIANPGGENDVADWSLCNTTLTNSLPTGSLTLTASSLNAIATTTTNPLSRSSSLSITSNGAVTSGHGFCSSTFTIDRADQSKVLQARFNYEVVTPSNMNFSGTIGSQTLIAYLYDVTNSAWVQPVGFNGINAISGPAQLIVNFQTNAAGSGNQYRLVVLFSVATSGAISINFDRFYCGPQQITTGAVVTDWQSFTPTGSWSTNTTYAGKYRQDGDSADINYYISLSGAPNSATLTVNLPTGLTIDTNKIPATANLRIGTGNGARAGSFTFEIAAFYSNTTSFSVQSFQTSSGTNPQNVGPVIPITQAAPYTWSNGDYISISIKVPIAGWSSNMLVSSANSNQRVVFQATSTTTMTTSEVTMALTSVVDTLGGLSGNTYTIKQADYYRIQAFVSAGSGAIGTDIYLRYKLDGVITKEGVSSGTYSKYVSFVDERLLNAGQQIIFYGQSNNASNTIAQSYNSAFIIEKLATPQSIAYQLQAPTITTLTSGTGTYTTPANCVYLKIKMIGGGGGGAGSGTSAGSYTNIAGGNTTFGTSLLTANGGDGGRQNSDIGNNGGTATIAAPAIGVAFTGSSGGPTTSIYVSGGNVGSGGIGGTSPLGGNGCAKGGTNVGVGSAAAANSGSGGGGANISGNFGGSGGGSGGYIEAIIKSPLPTYSYAVGTGGTAGGAGASGYAGGAGGSGVIIIEEHYAG